jgi:hypothetical protein
MTTTSTIALAELAEKGADVDMLRQMVQFMAQRLMEIDVEGRCGAAWPASQRAVSFRLDIETDDIPAEMVRLETLGAQVVSRLDRWVVMQAPTGQRFCVVRVQRPGFPQNANSWN